MTTLVAPQLKFHASWLAATREFNGAHRDGAGGWDWDLAELADPARFALFVAELLAARLPDTPRAPDHVPCTFLWVADGADIVGALAIRHELNEVMLTRVGHIGYSIRPSARRQGHARRALQQALPLARGLGITPVLVTCEEDNLASRATIERTGGVYADSRQGVRRYWIHPS